MQILREITENKGLAIALGYFDGIHIGHKKIITTLTQQAKAEGLKTAIVTFGVNPANYFNDKKIPDIQNFKDKELILRTTLIQSISDEAISISGLETKEENNERVQIIIYISMDNKSEETLKHLITRFTMEPEVFYVGYKVDNEKNKHLFDDDES